MGRSGLSVSRLILGTMNFGQYVNEEDSHRLLSEAVEFGINVVDTSNSYGGNAGGGTSESFIGRWFAKDPARRERVILATKAYSSDQGYGATGDWPNTTKLSAYNIRRSFDASLERLQTDHIDLFQMHHIDRATPFDEIWEAFDVLRQQGKVTYFGSSNFAGWHIAKASEAAARRGSFGLVSEQSLYNLLRRDIELEVLPACRDYGLGVIPWSPLSAGLLGGVLRKAKEGRAAGPMVARGLELHGKAIKSWEDLCDSAGLVPADAALAWLLAQPGVTGPIIGPRTSEQLAGSMSALHVTLGEDVLSRIDEIFPGPGGAAPEAYAW